MLFQNYKKVSTNRYVFLCLFDAQVFERPVEESLEESAKPLRCSLGEFLDFNKTWVPLFDWLVSFVSSESCLRILAPRLTTWKRSSRIFRHSHILCNTFVQPQSSLDISCMLTFFRMFQYQRFGIQPAVLTGHTRQHALLLKSICLLNESADAQAQRGCCCMDLGDCFVLSHLSPLCSICLVNKVHSSTWANVRINAAWRSYLAVPRHGKRTAWNLAMTPKGLKRKRHRHFPADTEDTSSLDSFSYPASFRHPPPVSSDLWWLLSIPRYICMHVSTSWLSVLKRLPFAESLLCELPPGRNHRMPAALAADGTQRQEVWLAASIASWTLLFGKRIKPVKSCPSQKRRAPAFPRRTPSAVARTGLHWLGVWEDLRQWDVFEPWICLLSSSVFACSEKEYSTLTMSRQVNHLWL